MKNPDSRYEAADEARDMLKHYQRALATTATHLDEGFDRAVTVLAQLQSMLVVTGLGKSGLIGQKVAATLTSTGTRAIFVHPVEALHGDLGVVDPKTAMLALSKSGANAETIEFARQFKAVTGGILITLTEPESKLERFGDIALHIPKLPEIDAWDLAPTTSGITTLAVCDALAICVQKLKGLTADDFAQFHPSGALGRRLLLRAQDVMVKGDDLPVLDAAQSFSDVLYAISSKGLGLVLLQDDDAFFGVLTDGDLRRLIEREAPVTKMDARACFHASRRRGATEIYRGSTHRDEMASDCLIQMQEQRITSLVVLNADRIEGLVRMQDLVAAGL